MENNNNITEIHERVYVHLLTKYPKLQNKANRLVKIHKHLKNIPSAAEIKKNNGIDLGEMSVKYLEKIEELTLYVIDLQKQIDFLKGR